MSISFLFLRKNTNSVIRQQYNKVLALTTLYETRSVTGPVLDKVHVKPEHDAQGCGDADERG